MIDYRCRVKYYEFRVISVDTLANCGEDLLYASFVRGIGMRPTSATVLPPPHQLLFSSVEHYGWTSAVVARRAVGESEVTAKWDWWDDSSV